MHSSLPRGDRPVGVSMVGRPRREWARLIDKRSFALMVGPGPHVVDGRSLAVTALFFTLYIGVGKRGGLSDGMSGAMAKTNRDVCRGSCFVTHLLPRTVSWGCPYRIVAPNGGGLSSSWMARYWRWVEGR